MWGLIFVTPLGLSAMLTSTLPIGNRMLSNPWHTVAIRLVELSTVIVLKCKLKQAPGEPNQLLYLNVMVATMTTITVVWIDPTEHTECSQKENDKLRSRKPWELAWKPDSVYHSPKESLISCSHRSKIVYNKFFLHYKICWTHSLTKFLMWN